MRIKIYILLSIFLLFSVNPTFAKDPKYHCECYYKKAKIDEITFVLSDHIFIGKVKEITKPEKFHHHVVFNIVKEFKNIYKKFEDASRETISLRVLNGDFEDLCGYSFKEGETYLVFATSDSVQACGLTRKLSDAGEDIKQLEKFVSQGLDKIAWYALGYERQDKYRKKWKIKEGSSCIDDINFMYECSEVDCSKYEEPLGVPGEYFPRCNNNKCECVFFRDRISSTSEEKLKELFK